MGVDYYANSVIGMGISPELLEKEQRRRGCGHPEGRGRYCAECGKPMYISTKESIDGFDGDTLFGLAVSSSTDNGYFVVHLVGVTTDSSRSDSDTGCKMIPLEDDVVAKSRQTIKEKLEPAGLWNEKTFGLWSILYCSY